jgi:heptosyltransferase-2
MNILVVRFSSMGDVILVTPLFSYLLQQYPGARITFVTGPAYAPLFIDDSRLFRTLVHDDGAHDASAALHGEKWDLAIDLQNNRRSHALCGSPGFAVTLGSFNKLHAKRWLLLLLRRNTYDLSRHVAARYIAVAAQGALPAEVPSISLFFSNETRSKTLDFFREQTGGIERPSIALFPFSAWKNKEWPLENFGKVGGYFSTKGWNVAIFGSPAEAPRAEALKKEIGARCVSLAGRLSLYECGALLSHFSLSLGNDTGLSHLARAAGVKAAILFGPTTRHFGFYPYGDPLYMIFENELLCRPCHAHGGNICVRMTHRCLRAIGYERVIAGLEALLNSPLKVLPSDGIDP